LDFRGSILCDFVYETSAHSASLAAIRLNKKYAERIMDDAATHHSPGGPYKTLNNTPATNILADEGIAWGMEVSSADADSLLTTVRRFRNDVSRKLFEEDAKVVD
jgi:hypothetical protein